MGATRGAPAGVPAVIVSRPRSGAKIAYSVDCSAPVQRPSWFATAVQYWRAQGLDMATKRCARKASTASDVWQFGLFLYELFTEAKVPYSRSWTSEAVMLTTLNQLHRGEPLPRPDGCSSELYDLMVVCWSQAPSSRPGFQELCESVLALTHPAGAVPPNEYEVAS